MPWQSLAVGGDAPKSHVGQMGLGFGMGMLGLVWWRWATMGLWRRGVLDNPKPSTGLPGGWWVFGVRKLLLTSNGEFPSIGTLNAFAHW